MGVADSVSGVADSVTRFRFFQTEATPRQFLPPRKAPTVWAPQKDPQANSPQLTPPSLTLTPRTLISHPEKYQKHVFCLWQIQKQIQDFDLGTGEMLCARSIAKSVYSILSVHPFHATCILCFRCSRVKKL